MKKIIFFCIILSCIAVINGCLVSDEVSDRCLENDQEIKRYSGYDNSFKEIKVGNYSVYYKVLKNANPSGIKPTDGAQVSVRYEGKLLDGTVFDNYFRDTSLIFPMNPVASTYIIPGFNEAIRNLQKGDSATVIMPSCVAFSSSTNAYGGIIPPYSSLVFEKVVLVNVRTEEQVITDYITAKKFKTDSLTKTSTGLRIISKNPGTGDFPKDDQTVTVSYRGFFLYNDVAFDPGVTSCNSNPAKYNRINFVVGKGNVIKGWDEGIKNIRVGGSAIFLIPSAIGYGSTGSSSGGSCPPPSIPGNTPLGFEIQVVSVQ
jgi:FKBP-type peptidyl-prolyl cis-trans isomerase